MIHSTFERLPEEKKDRILQAARAEFIRNPYEKTSINRILSEAEVPKGSFYQYFDDAGVHIDDCCKCNFHRFFETKTCDLKLDVSDVHLGVLSFDL